MFNCKLFSLWLSVACDESEFECHTSGLCIPEDYVCDGDDDCEDKSDEINCS